MSSTNRGAVRDIDDHYSTPPQVSQLICETLKRDGWVSKPSRLLEPGCGEGSFLDAMKKVWPKAERIGVDLNEELVDIAVDRGHEAMACNFLKVKDLGEPFDAAIGNPPFKFADDFTRRALHFVKPWGIVAYIQKLNWQGGQNRFRDFWTQEVGQSLAHEYVMPYRIGFTPNGRSDSIEYGVYIFQKGFHTLGKLATRSFLDNSKVENRWRGETWHWRRKVE